MGVSTWPVFGGRRMEESGGGRPADVCWVETEGLLFKQRGVELELFLSPEVWGLLKVVFLHFLINDFVPVVLHVHIFLAIFIRSRLFDLERERS